MSGFVADASLTLSWCFADEASEFSIHLLTRATAGEPILVPPHWPTEVLNGLLRAKRRGRVTEAEIQYFLGNLRSFDVSIDGWRNLSRLDIVRNIAERHSLTAYDAAYLELAMRMKLPLATRDSALNKAAASEGVLAAG